MIKHKLMAAMEAREAEKPKLAGRVEMDDAYLGGQRAGGKRDRGAAGKTPFVAAVETTAERKPRRLRLTVQGLPQEGDRDAGKARPRRRQQRGQRRPVCWTAVGEAGCDDYHMVTGSGPNAAKWVPFTWLNMALGNIKTALAGSYQHDSDKHAQRYLTSFAWRFNRRYQLDTLTERLAYAARGQLSICTGSSSPDE